MRSGEMMMMENKLWAVLCALLLAANLGSADHGNDHAAASQSALGGQVSTEAPAADSATAPRHEPTSHPVLALNGSDTNTSTSSTGSLSSNTTKGEETTLQVPELKNDTNMASPSVSAVPDNSSSQTEDLPSQPQAAPSENQTTTSQSTPTSPSQNITSSPPHTAHNTSVDATTAKPPDSPASLRPDSVSTSKQPAEAKTQQPTSASTPKPETISTTSTTSTTTTTTTQSMSTSSTSSTQVPPNIKSLTSPHPSQSSAPQDKAKSTAAPSSSSTSQAKAHADTPSQLNVGGDTMMVHESPTLDPLLAGLVTAFIITAVVITLLLFLKLRRRDNRPEFRRLQDLPMDDMMEDTPLSMYSY